MVQPAQALEPDWIPEDSFAVRLGVIRVVLGGWNLKRAALFCGIDPATWSNWEKGIGKPRDYPGVCRQIAKATGVNYEWLMVGGPLLTGRYLQYAQVRASLDLVSYDDEDDLPVVDAPQMAKPVLVTVG